eukprot:381819-Amphidinium_carterae.1
MGHQASVTSLQRLSATLEKSEHVKKLAKQPSWGATLLKQVSASEQTRLTCPATPLWELKRVHLDLHMRLFCSFPSETLQLK